jgi:hypothetical protein
MHSQQHTRAYVFSYYYYFSGDIEHRAYRAAYIS